MWSIQFDCIFVSLHRRVSVTERMGPVGMKPPHTYQSISLPAPSPERERRVLAPTVRTCRYVPMELL